MAIDFSSIPRIATDVDTGVTSVSIVPHARAQAVDVYVTVAGTFKFHADDTPAILPAETWTRVWDKSSGLATTPSITVALGSSGDVHARQS